MKPWTDQETLLLLEVDTHTHNTHYTLLYDAAVGS